VGTRRSESPGETCLRRSSNTLGPIGKLHVDLDFQMTIPSVGRNCPNLSILAIARPWCLVRELIDEPDSNRRANLEPQMNGGLRSLGGRLETRKSHSTLHFVAPLKIISNPLPSSARGDLRHTREEATRGDWGHCGT
jgi:hypothetical protein